MGITSCESSQPNSSQDWIRREELSIIKSVKKNWNSKLAAFKHGFGSSNTDELA